MSRTGHYAIFSVPARTGPETAPKDEMRHVIVYVEGAIGGGSGPVTEAQVIEFGAPVHFVRAQDVSALVDDMVHIDVSPEGE